MKTIFKNKRREMSNAGKLKKYLFYTIGELVLIILGILIAVNINNRVSNSKEDETRCAYQNELLFALKYDLKDTEENISSFKKWNPMIRDLYDALNSNSLEKVDSLNLKFGTVNNFIYLGQRSKSKIEELKYSPINLIKNRELKNKILLYQDEKIGFIKVLEERYKFIGEDLRKYYTKNFKGYNYRPAYPLDLDKIKKDNEYQSLVYQRLSMNYLLSRNYEELGESQKNIIQALEDGIGNDCK